MRGDAKPLMDVNGEFHHLAGPGGLIEGVDEFHGLEAIFAIGQGLALHIDRGDKLPPFEPPGIVGAGELLCFLFGGATFA